MSENGKGSEGTRLEPAQREPYEPPRISEEETFERDALTAMTKDVAPCDPIGS